MNDFEERLKGYKRRIDTIKNKNIVQRLQESDDFTHFTNNEIYLAHCLLHFFYGKKHSEFDASLIQSRHQSLCSEFKKRKLNHYRHDKLDEN